MSLEKMSDDEICQALALKKKSLMGIELHTASCHYCGTELEPDKPFNIDHKTPRSIIRDNKKLKNDIDNMVIACPTCNGLKGSTEYEEFKARMEVNK